MNIALYQAAAAMNATSRWQEAIAGNLSASTIPGFKRQDVAFHALQAGLLPAPSDGLTNHVMPRAAISTNFEQGSMRPTGVETDLALEGPGWFAVQLPNQTTALTRDGEFRVTNQGALVTKDGYPVLGADGPITLDPTRPMSELAISPTGMVMQGGDIRGRLRVMSTDKPELLTPLSNGYFMAAGPDAGLQDATVPSVRQKYLETANISPSNEMVQLITAMRMYEINQKVIQGQDERMSRTIQELGNIS